MRSMAATMRLFRTAAVEVGQRLGYVYLHEVDQRTQRYLEKVKNLDRGAQDFA